MMHKTFVPLLKKTDLKWLLSGELPDFTNIERMEEDFLSLPLHHIFTSIVIRSVDEIEWAHGETQNKNSWTFFKQQIMHECIFHIKSILGVLIDEQGMKINVSNMPQYQSVNFPYDKFAQPDILIFPIKQVLMQYFIKHNEDEIEDIDLTLNGSMVTLTLLMRIYCEINKASCLSDFKHSLLKL